MIRERVEERLRGFDRRELIGLAVVAALLVSGAAFWYVRSLPSRVQVSGSFVAAAPSAKSAASVAPSPSPSEVVVHVAGWVRHPGVFRLHQGDRVIDAIRRAGGARRDADLRSLNLAALLSDGQQIVVVRRGQSATGISGGSTISGGGTGSGGASSDVVNLNTATLDEIESLPGIGPVLAQRIVDYREQNGPFRTVEDLLNVSGIGDKRFADLKPHITV